MYITMMKLCLSYGELDFTDPNCVILNTPSNGYYPGYIFWQLYLFLRRLYAQCTYKTTVVRWAHRTHLETRYLQIVFQVQYDEPNDRAPLKVTNPHFLTTLSNVTVLEGDNLVLKCSASGF